MGEHFTHSLQDSCQIVRSFLGHCDNREGVHHFLFSVSSTRFSLPSSQCSSSIQRSPPTRARTDRLQHIQGGCSSSPHSSLRRVSILPCAYPVVISSSLVSPSLFPLSNGKSWISESAEQCMPASLHGDITLPHFHSMLNQPTGMLQDMCLCTDSWEFGLVLWWHWARLFWEVFHLNLNRSLPGCQKNEGRKKSKTSFLLPPG